jgi:hypothetical protein
VPNYDFVKTDRGVIRRAEEARENLVWSDEKDQWVAWYGVLPGRALPLDGSGGFDAPFAVSTTGCVFVRVPGTSVIFERWRGIRYDPREAEPKE